ncbi:MAG: class I SAM-dependent methyltransferase [Pseudonocardiaceae bacterium]
MIGSEGWVAEKFDRRALSYDQSAVHRWQATQAARFLAPRRGVDVLDVATGTGLVARELTGWLGSSGRIVGIDVSVEMLRRARRVCDPGVSRFVRANAQALPFRAGVFDAVVCVAAVPYFPDPEAALAEWRRVCRPQGQVVFTVPAPGGITCSRLLRQAAALEGIELDDPGEPLADAGRRDRLAAATGWTCDEVCEVVFEEPRADPQAAFAFVDSGFCEPLQTTSSSIRARVWVRFEALYRAESAEQHAVHLVRLRPLRTSS